LGRARWPWSSLFSKERKMPQVTWLGEEDESIEEAGEFKKGVPVEVTDDRKLMVYLKNRYFKVEGMEDYKKPTPEEDAELYPAPSTLSAQHPVAKPGEPVPVPESSPPVTPEIEEPVARKLKPVPKSAK